MNVRALFLSAFLAMLPLLCTAVEEPLVYDENCWVGAEQRVPSPCGEWEIVYSGRRHKDAPTLQRVTGITLRHRDGRIFLLDESHGKSASQVVLNPWSADGKWLAVQAGPRATAGFRFYPVAGLPQALMCGGLCFEVRYNGGKTVLACEQGAWAEDGSFTFLAGLSGEYAPYRASIAEDKVEVRRIGDFRRIRPLRSTINQRQSHSR